jgi:hypothetical protein
MSVGQLLSPERGDAQSVISEELQEAKILDTMELECENEPVESDADGDVDQSNSLIMNSYHTVCAPAEPQTVAEAMQSSESCKWGAATQDELNSLKENNAWVLVNRPVDRKIVRCKSVFKVKRDEKGNVARYKARLVAKGFTQQYGINYCETFSPIIRHSSIRFLFSLAAQLDLETDHLHVRCNCFPPRRPT